MARNKEVYTLTVAQEMAIEQFEEKKHDGSWMQFHKCNAYINSVTVYGSLFWAVKSYTTIVALVDVEKGLYIELGKWSVTTSKQVTRIYREMFDWTYRTKSF